jgi:hypothetical protein
MKCTLSFAALFTLLAETSTAAEAGRTLQVRLRNGTAGAGAPAGAAVRVETLHGDAKVSTRLARADGHGIAVFAELSEDKDASFRAVAEYAGVAYAAQELSFSAGEDLRTVDLTVYEATQSSDSLVASMAHFFFKPEGRHVRVEEMAVIENRGDRTYVGRPAAGGPARETLQFALPSGAFDVQTGTGLMSCCIVLRGNLIVDSMELLPGSREVGFSYRLPAGASTLEFERPLDLPIQQAVVIAQGGGLESFTEGLEPMAGPPRGGGQGQSEYVAFQAADLRQGELLKLRLTRLPQPQARTLPLVLVGAGVVLFVVVLALFLGGHTPAPTIPSPEALALAQVIAELDLRFEAGEVERGPYEAERALLRHRLVGLLK